MPNLVSPSFESNINNLPTLSWVKNINYQYIASSHRLIKLLGCHSEKNLYEHDDFDQPWAQYAKIYREEDKKVLSGNSLAFLHPVKLFSGEDFLVITRKFPYYDQDNQISGIMGNVTIVDSPQLMKNISALQKNDFEISAINAYEPSRYQVAEIFSNTNLSKRECACLFYLVRGKTAQEIANLLFISRRTVEKHIESIKDKFDCKTKSEIIEKAIALGFVSFIPSAFLCNGKL